MIFLQSKAQGSTNLKLNKTYSKVLNNESITLRFPQKKTIKLDSFTVAIDSSQLSFLKDFSLLDNNELIRNYKRHVFSGSKTRTISQFLGPIVILIDEKLPQEIKSSFINFIEDIPEIENLKFSFTKNLEDANYFIDIVDNEVSAYSKDDFNALDEQEILNDTFSQMTYKLYANKNNKFISCHYKISPSIINDSLFLTKLKKGFFSSLGGFYESYRAPKESFLNSKTDINNVYLSDYDIMVLKYHYKHLYQFSINSNGFDTLINFRKQLIN